MDKLTEFDLAFWSAIVCANVWSAAGNTPNTWAWMGIAAIALVVSVVRGQR